MRPTLYLIALSACSDYELHSPYTITQGGAPPTLPASVSSHKTVDSWTLTQSSGVDVLFFGDTSGSMTHELLTLGDEIITFVERLDISVKDWQLLAVTGPDGCGLHGVIGTEDQDYAQLFSEAITTPPGEDLVDEWGLYNVSSALMQTRQGDCNEGFIRDGAMLHVVFVSDEDDNSPGWDGGDPDYWQDYLNIIYSVKGDEDLVVLSAITGPGPIGCWGAEEGTGYNQAVNWTGGEQLSICEDWAADIELLADVGLLHQTDFPLAEKPIVPTIGVEVNGELIVAGWSYEAETQSVVFHQGAPATGDEVQIRYQVLD